MTDLRIMSFNILSDAPIWKKKWEDKPKEPWIYWDHRKKLILNIIKENDPDVFCLLECEYDQIEYFSSSLNDTYNYIYTSGEPKKSGETIEKYRDYAHKQNPGILVMFRREKVRVINNHAINYDYEFRVIAEREKWDDVKLNHFIKWSVSNIVLFELIQTEERFYYVPLHHFNDPRYGDVQYYQIYLLMDTVNKMNSFYNYPIVVCGDFNSVPNSAVVNFMKNNVLDKDTLYEDRYKIPRNMIDQMNLPESVSDQKKRFISVYERVFGTEPEYTTYTGHFNACIDYIFVSDDVQIKGVKDFRQTVDNWISSDRFMPNDEFPSDHIDLVADIVIKN